MSSRLVQKDIYCAIKFSVTLSTAKIPVKLSGTSFGLLTAESKIFGEL